VHQLWVDLLLGSCLQAWSWWEGVTCLSEGTPRGGCLGPRRAVMFQFHRSGV
jgi:hypothetical protein